jgi:RimJ/RimL family protein N-acetyltransferase
MAGVAVVGARVRLREMDREDPTAIASWYDEAATSAYEGRSLEQLFRTTGVLLMVAEPDAAEPIGVLEYVVKDGSLAIRFIALAKAYRGWGYGSEAVRLVEEWAVREGVAERFRADVDVRNGLGLYFWLRLGYRPAGSGEFDWQRNEARDKMPMVRLAANARM